MSKVCPHCRKLVEPHQLLERKIIPKGCVCNPREWFADIIDPICDSFTPMKDDAELCANCQHERRCHE